MENKGKKKIPGGDRKAKQKIFRRTIVLMVLCGGFMFVPLFAQLYDLQITKNDYYQEKAASQQTRDLAVSAHRGTIYDTRGNILAISATVQNLVISPKDIQANKLDGELIASGLAGLTGIDRDEILKRLTRTNSQYEVVKKKLEEAEAEAVRTFIKDNKLSSGIFLEPDSKRFYPYSSLAAHVLGFVGSDNTGLYGLETVYDQELSGTSGRVVTAKNGAGTEMLSRYENYIDAQDGYNLNLTLDATIQALAEKTLEEGIEKYEARKGGFCLVMDPTTGALLAMASSPEYDLNNYSTIADADKVLELEAMKADPAVTEEAYKAALGQAQIDQWRNKAINDTYEPGSTFKAMVVAAALEEGVVSLSDTFYCTGSAKVATFDISCSKRTGHKNQTLSQAVENSCNPAFMAIGQRLGAEKFYQYLQDFGFLNLTGIDLQGEAGSIVWSKKLFTSEEGLSSLAVASFGQTLKVTPIQLITAAASTINGGHLMEPYLLASVTDSQGNAVETTQPTQVRQVVSAASSDMVRDMMEKVVDGGTGRNAYKSGYRIGGKTGTSEKRDETTGDLIVSFLGFAPADNPKVIVLLAYDSPTPAFPGGDWTARNTFISGGNMAAPMAGDLIADIMDYLGVEKQYSPEELSRTSTAVPKVVGLTPDDATTQLKKAGFTCRTVGTGERITGQIPAVGALIPGGSEVIVYLGEAEAPTQAVVPDLAGKTPAGAREVLSSLGLYMKGSGLSVYSTAGTRAANQSITPGTTVVPGTVVEVTFVETVTDF